MLKILLIIILFFVSCRPSLPDDDIINESECNAPYKYDCNDIAILQSFIAANSDTSLFRHYLDNNSNGVIEPVEFGYQVWDDRNDVIRLIQLDLN